MEHLVPRASNAEDSGRRDRDEDLEQFAYAASHDLREPLMAIAGFATFLERRCAHNLDEQGRECLAQIIEGAKRMEQKIDDLLAFSRAGRYFPKDTFSLEEAVEDAKRSLCQSIERTGARIDVGVLPEVRGDRSMIAQVFQNLLSNSIKYCAPGIQPHIEIHAEPYEDDMWLVSVKDNGLGFDPKYSERVFEIFQRLYSQKEFPGTGIGLAIVKKIVERHKGRIWPVSAPGQGSTFHFTLPQQPWESGSFLI